MALDVPLDVERDRPGLVSISGAFKSPVATLPVRHLVRTVEGHDPRPIIAFGRGGENFEDDSRVMLFESAPQKRAVIKPVRRLFLEEALVDGALFLIFADESNHLAAAV
ncbi:hypothetical protein TSO221_21565 [Azospirillum sp. TSO22-1]|nr:hypothetical protein TSO221_21565 [Azospirillum sp. TSO22-1]